MTMLRERSKAADTATGRAYPDPIGSWTIDPSHSSVSLTWSRLRLATMTGRLHCLGVIHLDDLSPVGVIQFEQPSGLPVLTMALDPASVETGDIGLDARLRGPDVFDVQRHRWWMLRSESLQVLPSDAWRVMAALTANGTTGLVELRMGIDPEVSGANWLVLRGHGLLDRHAFGIGGLASTFSPQMRLELAVRARRVEGSYPTPRGKGEAHAQPACRAESGTGRATHDRSARAGFPCAVAWHWPADSPAFVEGTSLGNDTPEAAGS